MSEYRFTSEDEEEETQESEQETIKLSGPMKQLRDHAKKVEKDLRAANKELTDLRTFKAEFLASQRQSGAEKIFTDLGLSAKQAELFTKLNPEGDVTIDTVKSFADEYGFQVTESDETAETDAGFSPTRTQGEPASGKRYDSDQWFALYKENPAHAIKVAREGRVTLATEVTE